MKKLGWYFDYMGNGVKKRMVKKKKILDWILFEKIYFKSADKTWEEMLNFEGKL